MNSTPNPELPSNLSRAAATYPELLVGLSLDDALLTVDALLAQVEVKRAAGMYGTADKLARAAEHVNSAVSAALGI